MDFIGFLKAAALYPLARAAGAVSGVFPSDIQYFVFRLLHSVGARHFAGEEGGAAQIVPGVRLLCQSPIGRSRSEYMTA
jgi:hypothetical protein